MSVATNRARQNRSPARCSVRATNSVVTPMAVADFLRVARWRIRDAKRIYSTQRVDWPVTHADMVRPATSSSGCIAARLRTHACGIPAKPFQAPWSCPAIEAVESLSPSWLLATCTASRKSDATSTEYRPMARASSPSQPLPSWITALARSDMRLRARSWALSMAATVSSASGHPRAISIARSAHPAGSSPAKRLRIIEANAPALR